MKEASDCEFAFPAAFTRVLVEPRKSQAALKRPLAEVTEAVELVCKKQEGAPLRQMVTTLITTFLKPKCGTRRRVSLLIR
jgi:hypothetical protein